MNIDPRRLGVLLAIGATAVVGLVAACSSGAQDFASTDDGGPGSSGGASEDGGTDATLGSSGGSSGGSGSSGSGLVTYDGPPPNVDGGMLACSTPDGLPIKFNPIYSGYDSTSAHTYQVPVFVEGVDPSTITWGASDPSMVSFSPYVTGIMITTLAAGDVTIIARAGGKCGTAPMHITAFTPDDWNTGNARYNNKNPLNLSSPAAAGLPAGTVIPDGGIDAAGYDASAICSDPTFTNLMNPFEDPPAQCTNCHGAGSNGMIFGMNIFTDVEHTPEQTGGFSDDQFINVFVNGTVPDGGVFDQDITPYCLWQRWHKWQDIDSGAGQKGMVAYLRALPPQEQRGCFELFNAAMCADGGM